MKVLMLALVLVICMDGYGQKSRSLTIGSTATDWCFTGTYNRMFYGKKGKLGEFVYGNGFYVFAGKGTYPDINKAGAKDHSKFGFGFKWGSFWMEDKWWPSIDLGISHHSVGVYDGFKVDPRQPVFREWSFDFGSSAQVGRWFYSGVLVHVSRQLEMVMSFGVAF